MKCKFNYHAFLLWLVAGLIFSGLFYANLLAESSIKFQGKRHNHEGFAFWNANGTGNEPTAIGHAVPVVMGSQPYYMATADYDGIDPAAVAGLSAETIVSGFPYFSHMLIVLGFSLSDLTIKWDIYSLGNDIEGKDWWIDGNLEWRIYRSAGNLTIQMEGEDLVGSPAANLNIIIDWETREFVLLSEPFLLTDISGSSPGDIRALAQAFLSELGGQRVILERPLQPIPSSYCLSSATHGRCGGIFPTGDVFLKIRDDGGDRLPETMSEDKTRSIEKLQVYPNPFNPIVTVEFSLPHAGFVTLKIYNTLGQEVATLASEKLPSGNHKYYWDAGGLASGIYISRLETGQAVQTKKLFLLK